MGEPAPPANEAVGARLRRAAIVLWFISLALPGFLLSDPPDAFQFGYQILLAGLFFGWIAGGWAVYANLFFWYVVASLAKGRSPTRAVGIMLALTMTLPVFRRIPSAGGSEPVLQSWGWGVVVWVAAIVLLALAWAVATGRCSLRTAKWAIAGLAASLVGVVGAHAWQWREANAQERATTLAPGMAFTVDPLCHVAVTEVSGPLIESGRVIALEGDVDEFNMGFGEPQLPILPSYQTDGVAWALANEFVAVQIPRQPDSPVLRVERTETGARIELRASRDGAVVYEQRFRQVPSRNSRGTLCPLYAHRLKGHEQLGYDTHLRRALGQVFEIVPRAFPEAEETATLACPLGPPASNHVGTPRAWDGRTVRIRSEDLEAGQGFCSRSHLGLMRIHTVDRTLPEGRGRTRGSSVRLAVFDRENLAWRTWFVGQLPCDSIDCRLLQPEEVEAIEISPTTARLRTAIGDFALLPDPDGY